MVLSLAIRISFLLLLVVFTVYTTDLIDEEEPFDPFYEFHDQMEAFERKITSDLRYLETRISTMMQQKMNRLKNRLTRKFLVDLDVKMLSWLEDKISDRIRDGSIGSRLNNVLLSRVNNLERGYRTLKVHNKRLEADVRELKAKPANEATKHGVIFSDEEVMAAISDIQHLNRTVNAMLSCPQGFVFYGQSCYHFTNSPISWSEAVTLCHGFAADLVKVDDKEEDDFIVSQLKSLPFVKGMDGYWTGGRYIGGKWIWRDGTIVQYTRWAPGEPDQVRHHQYLAYIRPERWYPKFQWASQLTWRDKHGRRACGAICETKVIN